MVKALGVAIRGLRNRARLSQEDYAALTGLDRTHISRIEQGRVRDPGLRLLERLARPLGPLSFVIREAERILRIRREAEEKPSSVQGPV